MIRIFLQRTVLLSLIITVATPAQAFWGQDKLLQLVDRARSYAAQVYERPQEHKAAIAAVCGAGLVAVAAIGAYSIWGASRTNMQPDEPVTPTTDTLSGEQHLNTGGQTDDDQTPSEGSSYANKDNPALLIGAPVSTDTSSHDNAGLSSNDNVGDQSVQPEVESSDTDCSASDDEDLNDTTVAGPDLSSNGNAGNRTEGQLAQQLSPAEHERLCREAQERAAAEERAMQEYLAQLAAKKPEPEEERQRKQEEEFLKEAYGQEPLPQKPAADKLLLKNSATSNDKEPSAPSTSSDNDRLQPESDSEDDEDREEVERLKIRQKWRDEEVKPLTQEQIDSINQQEALEADRKRQPEEQRLRDEEEARAKELQYRRELEEAQRVAQERERLLCLIDEVQQVFVAECGRTPTDEEIVDLALAKVDQELYQRKLYEYKAAEACRCLTGVSLSPEQLANFAPEGAWINLIEKAYAKRAEAQRKQQDEKEREELWRKTFGYSERDEELSKAMHTPFQPIASSSSPASSSRSPSPDADPLSASAQAYMDHLGVNPVQWPKELSAALDAFRALDPEVQQEILNHLRVRLNDGKALPTSRSETKISIFARAKSFFSREPSENEKLFKEYYAAVREHAHLQFPMYFLEQKHKMTVEKKAKIGAMLEEALHEALGGRTDFMGISASGIKNMEEEPLDAPTFSRLLASCWKILIAKFKRVDIVQDIDRKLRFMVRILKPHDMNGNTYDSDKIALFMPIHGTFADFGNYGSGTNYYDNGPRLIAAAQRMADAKGVTLHVIIPNWDSRFEEYSREEAACYILPLIQKWYTDNMAKDIAFIDLLGHSEGNSVITLMLKGIANRELKQHIRWLSVCPTAGSDYIPVGCKARVTIWSPADALAFIASATRFMTYRKQSGLNQHIDSLFTNISLSYNGVPENHVTAKYRACALYDEVFDIAERFKGHCELSMDVNEANKEILVAARRGKEACLLTFDETRKDIIEQVSLQAEERYRALYPDANKDWHEKPHDWATFLIRYPEHGERESKDGAKEDAAIAEAEELSEEQKKNLYKNAQNEAIGRVHYGWHETYAEPLPIALNHAPFLFKDASKQVRDIAAENKVDLGDFVYQVLNDQTNTVLKGLLRGSAHRKEFISALIAYFDVFAPRLKGFGCDAFRIQDTENQDLFSFMRNGNFKKLGKSSYRVIELGSDTQPLPFLADDYSVSVHGLPRGNDHIIITPISKISQREFILKLGKTVSQKEVALGAGGSLIKSAVSSVLAVAPAAARFISRAPSPAPTQTFAKDPYSCVVPVPESIMHDFEYVLNRKYSTECIEKHVLRERARLGGVCEINKMLSKELKQYSDRLPERSKAALATLLDCNRLQLGDERPVYVSRMTTLFADQHTKDMVSTYLVKRRMIDQPYQPQALTYGGLPVAGPTCSSSNY